MFIMHSPSSQLLILYKMCAFLKSLPCEEKADGENTLVLRYNATTLHRGSISVVQMEWLWWADYLSQEINTAEGSGAASRLLSVLNRKKKKKACQSTCIFLHVQSLETLTQAGPFEIFLKSKSLSKKSRSYQSSLCFPFPISE